MLETERLRLRPWVPEDAAFHRDLWLERDLRVPPHRRIDADGRPSVEDLAEWIRRAAGHGGPQTLVVESNTAERIGYCGLVAGDKTPAEEPEIAFELLRRHWGRGYATEAASAVIASARAAGYQRLWATVRDWNTPSRRVLAKLGFIESGRVDRDAAYGDSIFTTILL